ncbi:MAG: nuclear transport factor 2 family protein [Verrucomicrobiota bacterium]
MSPITGFFNGLTPEKLDTLGDIYSPGVEFQNPLRQIRGLPELRRVYEHLFQQLEHMTVAVTDVHGDDRTGFLLWTMNYQYRGMERSITGTSHIRFAPDGRVAAQTDHWDASFPIYGEYPLLGWAMRNIKRLAAAKTKSED